MNEIITRRVLEVLEASDGTCLDNERERARLADALAVALLDLLVSPPAERGAR